MAQPRARRASFDLFDTLLGRPFVKPWHLFAWVARGTQPIGWLPRFVAYAWLRRCAELAARVLALPREDIGLEDIRRPLRWLVSNADTMLEAELEAEQRLLRPISEGVNRFRAAESLGQHPLVISDMYLPASFLQSVLEKWGIHAGRVYVSSEAGLRKGSGSLFRHVARVEGVPPEQWVHCGDHPRSDQARPAALGMSIDPFPRPVLKPADPSLLSSVIAALGASSGARGFWHRIGAEVAGPIALGMARWLRKRAEAGSLETLVFLGRDGYLLKAFYERLYPGLPTAYLELSRRAILLPSLFDLGPDALRLLFWGVDLSVDDFFLRLGLPRPESFPCGRLKDHEAHVRRWLLDHEPEVLALCARERSNLLEYLQSLGLKGRVALVDIGWHATIQEGLETLARRSGLDVSFHGLYFGTIHPRTPHCEGWFFHHGRPLTHCGVRNQSVALLEFLFTEPVPSVVRVGEGGILERLEDEAPDSLEARREIREGALGFLEHFLDRFEPDAFTDHEYFRTITANLRRLLGHPSPEALYAIGQLTHRMGFGSSPAHPMVAPPSGRGSLREYVLSNWRAGYVAATPFPMKPLLWAFHKILHTWLGQACYAWVYAQYDQHLFRKSRRTG